MTLSIRAFALAFGIWWGAGVFIATWWLIYTGVPGAGPMLIQRFYPGYAATPAGSLAGLFWGFVCGTICGGILAWLYNILAGSMGRTAAH
jgi:hypothetical protein